MRVVPPEQSFARPVPPDSAKYKTPFPSGRQSKKLRPHALPLLIATLLAADLPPIHSTAEAIAELALEKSAWPAALKNLRQACGGVLRHELRDQPAVLGRLKEIISAGDQAAKKAVLETDRCFTAGRFFELLRIALADADPSVISAGAEAAARVADPGALGDLLDAAERRATVCAAKDLAAPELDACVWLAYAPGALIGGADPAIKERAAKLAIAGLSSTHAKVREVSVETLAHAKIKRYAQEIDALVAREQKKDGFSEPNSAALIRAVQAARGGAQEVVRQLALSVFLGLAGCATTPRLDQAVFHLDRFALVGFHGATTWRSTRTRWSRSANERTSGALK